MRDAWRTVATLAALVVPAALVVVSVTAQQAAAQDPVAAVRVQLRTAIFHSSELAQRGTAVAASRLHMQHTVNCLEGPEGPNFSAAAGHPCQGQGNGIIPDLQRAVSAGARGAERAMVFVRAAHTLALQALKSNDVNEVQPFAIVVARNLQQAMAVLGP
ncbi:MAG: hypothetical protein QN122_05350 [Armatimonadota bacterium]|nr:hypothetical protein [Armatimonadota bacterium]MDR7449883.1 hypothetical protein [Armatimonadota bacterium]MDR7459207.1 hypothetical protein [Armatimonadota bacterium]MDR7479691.1 hypothetical protein [Armatimonadota bacterium]MDR7487828.1 hypothetical protein [Armatimonadota bacterium]